MQLSRTYKTIYALAVRLSFILAIVFTLTACGFFRAPGKDKCDKLLSREKMTNILTDIYLLESYIREQQQFDRSINDSADYYYYRLLRQYDVELNIFEAALDCYLLDRHEMDAIHEEMLNRLSVKESEISIRRSETEGEAPPVIPD
jgi:hypothetical protein